MSFDYRILSFDAMTVAPLSIKETDPMEYKRLNAIRSGIIEIWVKHDERYLLIGDKKYKVVEVNSNEKH